MLLKYCLTFLLNILGIVKGSKNVEINFIKDYIRFQNDTFGITAFVCWNFEQIINLNTIISETNITANYRTTWIDPQNINIANLYILDFSCPNVSKIIQSVEETNYYRMLDKWLILLPEDFSENYFSRYYIPLNSKFIIAIKNNSETYYLKYIYKINKNASVIIDHFSTWKNDEGILYYDNEDLTRKRRNLRKNVLKSLSIVMYNRTYEHMDDYRYNHEDLVTKINYMLITFLADFLNATLEVLFLSKWYGESLNQTDTGVGAIVTKQIDISGTPFFIFKDRLQYFEYLALTTPNDYVFIFRQPPLSYVANIFTMPFNTTLWLTNISILLVCSIFLYYIVQWEWKRIKEKNETPEVDMISPAFSDAILFTIGAVCNQGYATEPKGSPGKLIMLTVFITLIFLFTAYSAYTVVLFQSTADNIRTLEDIYNSRMTLGSEDQPYYRRILPTYTEKWRQKIYQDRIAPQGKADNFYDIHVGLERVQHEYFAFHVDCLAAHKIISDTYLEHEKCGIQAIKYMEETNPHLVAPVGVPYNQLYKIALFRMKEVGINTRELKRRSSPKPACTTQGNNYRSAGLLDLYSVYMLLLLGIGLSVALVLFEIIVHKSLEKRDTKIKIMKLLKDMHFK